MKKFFTLILAIVVLSLNSFADDPLLSLSENDELNLSTFNVPSDSEYELSIMNLQVDVMGIIFFGPQITLDFQFADMIAVGPYFRWHYAGVLYQAVVTDWFSDETTTSLASYSLGAQAKFLIPVGSGQHRPYLEVGYEKSKGSDSWDPGGTWGKRIYEYESNVFHFNFGYRLLTQSSFNLSAALGVGISQDTKSIGYYEFGDEPDDQYTLETRLLPMVQVMLGWQLGK